MKAFGALATMASRPPPRRPAARPAKPAPARALQNKPLRLKGEAPDPEAGEQTVVENDLIEAAAQTVVESDSVGAGRRTVVENAADEDTGSKTVVEEDAGSRTVVEEDIGSKTVVEEDELALQPVHSGAQAPQKPVKYHRPVARTGVSHEAIDSSRFLLLAGIVVVIVVIASAFFVFRDPPVAPAPSPSPKVVEKVQEKKEPDYLSNRANPEAFHAFVRFMKWAYEHGQDLKADALIAKLNVDVPTKGVTDPAILEILSKMQESFRLGGEQPLRRLSGEALVQTGPHGAGTFEGSDKSRNMKLLNLRIKELSRIAEGRYGSPADATRPPG